MIGIDGKSHFYKSSERTCCVKRKKITDNELSAEESYYLANRGAFAFAQAQVYN